MSTVLQTKKEGRTFYAITTIGKEDLGKDVVKALKSLKFSYWKEDDYFYKQIAKSTDFKDDKDKTREPTEDELTALAAAVAVEVDAAAAAGATAAKTEKAAKPKKEAKAAAAPKKEAKEAKADADSDSTEVVAEAAADLPKADGESVHLKSSVEGAGEKAKNYITTNGAGINEAVAGVLKAAGFKHYARGDYWWIARPGNVGELVHSLEGTGMDVSLQGYLGKRGSASKALRDILKDAGIRAKPEGDRDAAEFGPVKAVKTEEGMLQLTMTKPIDNRKKVTTDDSGTVAIFLQSAAKLGILNLPAESTTE